MDQNWHARDGGRKQSARSSPRVGSRESGLILIWRCTPETYPKHNHVAQLRFRTATASIYRLYSHHVRHRRPLPRQVYLSAYRGRLPPYGGRGSTKLEPGSDWNWMKTNSTCLTKPVVRTEGRRVVTVHPVGTYKAQSAFST